MRNQNELFYSVDANFDVVLNSNMPVIEGISGYAEMPEGNLRFFAEGRNPDEEKGCWFNEKKDGTVVFGYYDASKNSQNCSVIRSTGQEYVRVVNDLVKAWFTEGGNE